MSARGYCSECGGEYAVFGEGTRVARHGFSRHHGRECPGSRVAPVSAPPESARAQLGELLVQAVEANGGLFVEYFKAEKEWFVAEPGSDLNGQQAPTLTDALMGFRAKAEDA